MATVKAKIQSRCRSSRSGRSMSVSPAVCTHDSSDIMVDPWHLFFLLDTCLYFVHLASDLYFQLY